MGISKFVFSFFLFFISFSSSMNGNHKCPDKQRDALLVFKQNISSNRAYEYYYASVSHGYDYRGQCELLHGFGYDPVKIKWETSIDCCDWDGIGCDNFTGDVISLNLECGKLQGVAELDILLSGLPKLAEIVLSYSGLSVVTRNVAYYVNSDLYELRLAACNLTVFPYFLRAMKNLQVLDLSSNYISGHIPEDIGEKNLTYLDLSQNSITSLPQFTSDGLQYLDLQTNELEGSFPPWICNMKHLKYLDVSYNSISGKLPQCLQNLSPSLVSLNVKLNMIQGSFPTIICNMGSLLYLDMSYNNLSGLLPQCFGNMTSSFAMINLGGNKFNGTIPNVCGNCGLSIGLVLEGNMFEGEVPKFLAKCQSIKILDLGNNQLNGTFPRWLGDLPELQVLILRSNNFHGTIETPGIIDFLFRSLRVFDVSSNGFVGRLPEKYFESFNAIKDVDREQETKFANIRFLPAYSINFKSIDLQVGLDFDVLSLIDLSSNKFEGDIPNIIGNLKSLISLNLSNNNLSGQIPLVLENLESIEIIDLSRNQLEGEISQSLIKLNTLEVFNVSQNHLVGRIPDPKGQFSTFTKESYLGNVGLCGPPLLTDCEDLHSPQVEAKGGEWIYIESVMSGLGFGTLLGVVLGNVMLSTGRPKWLNAIVEAGGHTRPKKRKQVHIRKPN